MRPNLFQSNSSGLRLFSWTILCTALVLFTSFSASAQKLFANKAVMNETRYQYMDASDIYLGFLKNGDRESALRAAVNLYKARMYQQALPLYELADSLRIIDNPEELFGYYECLKSMKRYRDADALVRNNIANYANRREFQLNDGKLEYYKKLESFNGAELKLLPLNSKFSDISPTVYKDWLYFVSTRPAANNKEIHRINMQPFYNLYTVPVGSDMLKAVHPKGDFGKPETTVTYQNFSAVSIPNGINKKYHDGPILATSGGSMIFFTTNWSHTKRPKNKLLDVNLLIYYCVKEGNTWSEPRPLPFNSFSYSNQHGYFDEKSATLYFSSNMPGGQGGYDIWKSNYRNDTWEQPVNLGDKVNTPKNEVFPTITPDGRLIFSSNGWPGLGGLDLYMVDDQEAEPMNLMAGMNSELDDFGLVFVDKESGYLVSNRPGGVGDDDIYSFKLDLKQVRELMAIPPRVVVVNVKDAVTGKPIEGVRITLSNYLSRQYTTGTKPVVDTIAYNASDESKPEIIVRYEIEGYAPIEKKISSWPQDQLTLDLSVSMEPLMKNIPVAKGPGTKESGGKKPQQPESPVKVEMLDNQKFIIYFDFDKFNIRKDASEILAKVAYVLLQEYEMAEVMLTGHTDTRGSYAYNEQLSKNRVNTAKRWLVERGVDPKRIKTDYNGERKLAVMCADPITREQNIDACLTREQHQLNRRVEIEIMNIIKNN